MIESRCETDAVRDHRTSVIHYWDSVAVKYLDLFRDEFQHKAFDRSLLRDFADVVGPRARVCDVGCGPCGHVTRLLADFGLDVIGVDISPVCVELARREQPSLEFRVMEAENLQFEESSFDGLVAYYLFHFLPRGWWPLVLAGFARVLRPGGKLLIVMKQGEGEEWIGDPLGGAIDTFWAACGVDELQDLILSARFRVVKSHTRRPYENELTIDRIYLQAECAKSLKPT